MSVLGLDVGTSTCKGIALSEEGKILAQRQRSYAEQVRTEGKSSVISAECFWENAKQIIREVSELVKEDPIEAISVSCHGETLIPIDSHGEALTPAILSMDRRSEMESDRLVKNLGQDRIYHLTGAVMHPQFPIPKVMWLKKEHPDLVRRSAHYDSTSDYIYRRLGFPEVVDYSIASRFGGFDIYKKRWSEEILGAAGISPEVFSKPVCAGTVLGYIPKEIASELGIGGSVKLVAGGHDQPCAAIGMGNVEKGTVTVSAGSYECAAVSTETPLNTEAGQRYGLNSYCHVLPGQYITLAFFVSGMMTQWYIDLFGTEEKREAKEMGTSPFALLDSRCRKGPTGICITPHIFGAMNPEWSEKQSAKVTGLTALATRADFYKAVLEGNCCELDLNLQVLEKLMGKIQKILMTGGGTKSENWMQIRADITEKQIDVTENGVDASCLGAAFLAGLGSGMFTGISDANARVSRNVRTYLPQNSDSYAAQKAQYLTLHRAGLLNETG